MTQITQNNTFIYTGQRVNNEKVLANDIIKIR